MMEKLREALQSLEKNFLAELEKKPSWGKNEVKAAFQKALMETLMGLIK